MAAVIQDSRVEAALRPWVGSHLLRHSTLGRDIANVLRSYAPYKEDLAALAGRLEQSIFMGIRYFTDGTMGVILDSGRETRIYISDLHDITDDVLEVLFLSFTPYSVTFELLKEFILHNYCLSALKILYLNFKDFQSEEELEAIAKVIQRTYPKERWEPWLTNSPDTQQDKYS